jgi:hypothetical protein
MHTTETPSKEMSHLDYTLIVSDVAQPMRLLADDSSLPRRLDRVRPG